MPKPAKLNVNLKKGLTQKEIDALIDEAKTIKLRMKADEKRLDEIKKLLSFKSSGTHTTSSGSACIVTEVEQFNPPDALTILEELKNRRQSKRFMECVKVVVTKTREILGEDWYNLNRIKKDSTFKHEFK